jgi:hypothetical protein
MNYLGYGRNPKMPPAYAYFPPQYVFYPVVPEVGVAAEPAQAAVVDGQALDQTALAGASAVPSQSLYQGPSYWYGY